LKKKTLRAPPSCGSNFIDNGPLIYLVSSFPPGAPVGGLETFQWKRCQLGDSSLLALWLISMPPEALRPWTCTFAGNQYGFIKAAARLEPLGGGKWGQMGTKGDKQLRAKTRT
jgi:hypothetical protein